MSPPPPSLPREKENALAFPPSLTPPPPLQKKKRKVLTYFRGSELQNYFTRVLEDDLVATIKPQYVDHIPKAVRGNVGQVIEAKDAGRGGTDYLLEALDLRQVLDRDVEHLSGGELQRFAIAVVAAQEADVYMVDEPSSYLDVRQRLKAAQVRGGRGAREGGRVFFFFSASVFSIFFPAWLFFLRNFPVVAPFPSVLAHTHLDRRDAPSFLLTVTSSLPAPSPAPTNENETEIKKKVIRSLLGPKKYVIVVEHDLAVLDYLSDFVCCLYGKPGAYGVVTLPFSVREGINVFLAGFVPTENLRFREEALSFKVAVDTSESESAVAAASAAATAAAASSSGKGKGGKGKEKAGEGGDDEASATAVGRGGERYTRFTYPAMTKTQGSFKLTVESGDFTDSEIIVMLGENGTGKTTLIRMLGGCCRRTTTASRCPSLASRTSPRRSPPSSRARSASCCTSGSGTRTSTRSSSPTS